MRNLLFFVLMLSILPAELSSETIHVPGDYAAIQMAIDAAKAGDTVLVASGTYEENIDFKGKTLLVASEQGPDLTTICGDGSDSVVVFSGGEQKEALLSGFTITNGHAQDGGGVRCVAARPTITGNVITGNTAESGGGIFIHYNNPKISYNIIASNEATEGGGIFCLNATPAISHNTIRLNEAENGAGLLCRKGAPGISYNAIGANTAVRGGGCYVAEGNPVLLGNMICANTADVGGGIASYSEEDPEYLNNLLCWNIAHFVGGGAICSGYPALTGNTVVRNIALSSMGAGLYISDGFYTHALIVNCILWGNQGTYPGSFWEQIYPPGQGTCYWISHCVVQGGLPGGTAIIDADPLFVDEEGGDFHIQYGSPCLNTGSSSVSSLPELDIEGDPRVALGDADIGADEFHTHLYTAGSAAPGGYDEARLVGVPGTSPVALFLGTSVLSPPMQTPWGPFYLQGPYLVIGPLGAIPAAGVLALGATVPLSPPAPYNVAMQALIGWNADSLTNLCVLEVR